MRKNSPVGGQAVLEGVMMRNPTTGLTAMAVRRIDGQIALECKREPCAAQWPWWRKVPFVRGVTNFVLTLQLGMTSLTRSVELAGYEEEEPSKFEKWLSAKTGKSFTTVATAIGGVLGVGLALGLFVLLPQLLATLLGRVVALHGVWLALSEGLLRLVIFVCYLLAMTALKDIRRFFAYHGAEHKTINCYEAQLPLTVENVRRQGTGHPRCGTAFLLVVMVVSILVFALTALVVETEGNMLLRLAVRLVLLPVVAAISYELLMVLAKHENPLTRMLRAPGMLLQKLTTREADAQQCEVAIRAFAACLSAQERANCLPQAELAALEAMLGESQAAVLGEQP